MQKLKIRQRDHALMLNQCPPQRQSLRVQMGVDSLAAMGALIAPLIVARADYQDAARKGLGVTELNAGGAAAAEIRALWRSLRARADGEVFQASDAA